MVAWIACSETNREGTWCVSAGKLGFVEIGSEGFGVPLDCGMTCGFGSRACLHGGNNDYVGQFTDSFPELGGTVHDVHFLEMNSGTIAGYFS